MNNKNEKNSKEVAATVIKTSPSREETELLEEKTKSLRAATNLTAHRLEWERAENTRRSLASPYPFGKDCTRGFCHPYVLVLKQVLWGFSSPADIDSKDLAAKFTSSSNLATRHMQTLFSNHRNSIKLCNLVSGLLEPLSFSASLSTLSADDTRSYYFWPYVIDPNPENRKHGRITWECRDIVGDLVATKSFDFIQDQTVSISCNEVPSKFPSDSNARKAVS